MKRRCEECGKEFHAKRPDVVRCGKKCTKRAKQRRGRALYQLIDKAAPHRCKQCGHVIEIEHCVICQTRNYVQLAGELHAD